MADGYDFAELTHYSLGEDAKKIDWKSTAKTGIPHIKKYFQENEATVVVAALLSKTILFGDKKNILIDSCKSIANEILKSKNRLKPIIITDYISSLPESKNRSSIKHFIDVLKKNKLKNIELNIQDLNKYLKNKTLLILIGDFLDHIDLTLLSKKHEIFVLIIRDKFEQNPHILGDREFIDLSSGEKSTFYFGQKELDSWKNGYDKNDYILIKHLNSLGINYHYKVT